MRKMIWGSSILLFGVVSGAAALHAAGRPDNAGVTSHGGVHQLMRHLHGSGDEPCDLIAAIHAHFEQVHTVLELTDAQKEAIHTSFRDRRTEFVNAVRPVVEAKRALINAVHADTTDEAAVRAAGEQVGRSLGEAAVVIARIKTDVLRSASLTPEQSRKLSEMRDRMDASIGRLLDLLQPPAENPGR